MEIRLDEDVLPLTELRAHLAEKIEDLRRRDGCLVVTRNGRTAAVILSPKQYDRLRYQSFVRAKVARAREDVAEGRTVPHDRVMREARQIARGKRRGKTTRSR